MHSGFRRIAQNNSWKHSASQGNSLKSIDKKTVRREGIKPIKKVFNCVLFSLHVFITEEEGWKLQAFIYKTLSKKF